MNHSVNDISHEESYIRQNRYALALFLGLLALLAVVLIAYAGLSYSFSVAGAKIDDVHGSMEGYYVLSSAGVLMTDEAKTPDNDITKEGNREDIYAPEITCSALATPNDYAHFHEEEGRTLDAFLDKKVASYVKKGAIVLPFDISNLEDFRYGGAVARDGVTYGMLFVDDKVLDETGMRVIMDQTEEARFAEDTQKSETSNDGTQGEETSKDEFVLDALEQTPETSKIPRMKYNLSPDFEAYIEGALQYFKQFKTDVVVIYTSEPALLEMYPQGDIVVALTCDTAYPKKGKKIKDTFFIQAPYLNEIGVITIAPGKVITAKTFYGNQEKSHNEAQ
ncbi:MAG: hypothetical protein IJV62_02815 [Eggerthellaceae bacterium]|nr:hypothetical protein [Eggerthellaceae bacterium]